MATLEQENTGQSTLLCTSNGGDRLLLVVKEPRQRGGGLGRTREPGGAGQPRMHSLLGCKGKANPLRLRAHQTHSSAFRT